MEEHAIVKTNTATLMPVIDIEEAVAAYKMMVDFTSRIMRKDIDYGIIPGTPKPTLLKPGAEKLNRLFGLAPRFSLVSKVEDWGKDGSEPLFMYHYKCELYRISDGAFAGEGDGSCNSHEKKYRWRSASLVCPECGSATVFKSKDKPEYYCWKKKGGCGAVFKIDDARITSQDLGKVINPEIPDTINTILKMAQKRALIAATLIACNASEYYTQDLEDLDLGFIEGEIVEAEHGSTTQRKPAEKPAPAPKANPRPASANHTAPREYIAGHIAGSIEADAGEIMTNEARQTLAIKMGSIFVNEDERHAFMGAVLETGKKSITELTKAEGRALYSWASNPNARRQADDVLASLGGPAEGENA